MPNGCSADYCTNSNKKGFQLCRIPKDSERRKVWIQNMNRTEWNPTINAKLCEVHFTPDMWLMRKDGSRRLKSDAVPTIFGENLQMTLTMQMKIMTETANTKLENKTEEISSKEDITEEEKNDIFISIPSNKNEISNPSVLQRLERLEKLWEKSELLRFQMKKKLGQAKRKVKRLETQVRKN